MYKERAKPEYVGTDKWDDMIGEWSNISQQIKLDGTTYDSLLIDQIIEIETDIHIYLKKRMDNGLEILASMKSFRSIAEVWKEQLTNEPVSILPPNAPTIDEVIDHPTQLYMLADDLRFEYEQGEFSWAESLTDVYRWAEHKYTYQGGKRFKAKALFSAYHKARFNEKL